MLRIKISSMFRHYGYNPHAPLDLFLPHVLPIFFGPQLSQAISAGRHAINDILAATFMFLMSSITLRPSMKQNRKWIITALKLLILVSTLAEY